MKDTEKGAEIQDEIDTRWKQLIELCVEKCHIIKELLIEIETNRGGILMKK